VRNSAFMRSVDSVHIVDVADYIFNF